MLDDLSPGQSGKPEADHDYQAQDETRLPGPTILHEGHSIIVDIPEGVKRDTFMLPLRNGFPIYVNARHAPVFALHNHVHEIVGLAVKIAGYGLSVHFSKPVSGGRFYFQISGPIGVA